jgi:predicted ester cyclase
VNHQDLSRIDAQLTADFVDHAMPPGTPRGPGPVKAWLTTLRRAFPDLHVVTDDVVAEGDRVAVRAPWTGTHTDEIFGVARTGRKVTFSGAVFWRIRGDRIAERWAFLDTPSLMRQLTA